MVYFLYREISLWQQLYTKWLRIVEWTDFWETSLPSVESGAVYCAWFLLYDIGGKSDTDAANRIAKREWTPFLDSMFTATSATCVTGLVVYDTFTHWNVFGQLVILLLIQIGGLGFITVGVGFSMAFRRRIGLWQRDLLKESINAMELVESSNFHAKSLSGQHCVRGREHTSRNAFYPGVWFCKRHLL